MARCIASHICRLFVGWLFTFCAVAANVPSSKTAPSTSPTLTKIRNEAFQLVQKQDFEQAISRYEQARKVALSEKNQTLATQFLLNIGGCYHTISAYRAAMQYYQSALAESRQYALPQLEITVASNLATLLLEMGDAQGAAAVLNNYPLDGSRVPKDGRVAAFIQQMNVFGRLKRQDAARAAFDRALAAAAEPPSPEVIAASRALHAKWPSAISELRRAWVYAAYAQVLTFLDQPNEAESYALEAFRIRSTYQDKARLRDALQLAIIARKRNQPNEANQLLAVARNLDKTNRMPMHLFLLDREAARVSLSQGDFATALPNLRRAIAKARSWRLEVLPSTSSYLSFETNVAYEMQQAFLDSITHNELNLQQKGLAEESFWIAEEVRFASMRTTQFQAGEFSTRLPNRYWTLLTQFRQAQIRQLSGAATSDPEELTRLQTEMNVIEIDAGLKIPQSSPEGIPRVQSWLESLPADEAVFSYHLAEPYSLAWVATRKGITVRRIAGRKQIATWVQQFRDGIAGKYQNGALDPGLKLYEQLFGEESGSRTTIPFWTMVLDQELSSLPVAALPVPGKAGKYLVELHSLRTLPSAIFLEPQKPALWARQAAGMGDSVYNSADVRITPVKATSTTDWLQLNRLPGSGAELQNTMTVLRHQGWNTQTHTGVEANPDSLRQVLRQSPDIVHLSSHFVEQADNPSAISIVLSPSTAKGTNGANLFNALDLKGLRASTKLVVLSGCNSSSGQSIPSIGVNGIARAFLLTGVNTVVATLWPTADNKGPLFPVFYQDLTRRAWTPRSAAQALRAAQLAMIRQGGWMANPSYWATYVAISRG